MMVSYIQSQEKGLWVRRTQIQDSLPVSVQTQLIWLEPDCLTGTQLFKTVFFNRTKIICSENVMSTVLSGWMQSISKDPYCPARTGLSVVPGVLKTNGILRATGAPPILNNEGFLVGPHSQNIFWKRTNELVPYLKNW